MASSKKKKNKEKRHKEKARAVKKTLAPPRAPTKKPAKDAAKTPAKIAAAKPVAPPPKTAAKQGNVRPQPGPAPAVAAKPAPRPGGAKKGRRGSLSQRRGPDGQLLAPGELLLPGGAQRVEEAQYLFRGCAAAEHAALDAGMAELMAKRGIEGESERPELNRQAQAMSQRFDSGTIEPMLPNRPPGRRNFAGVVERAKHRRREIGAFLRGLDVGRTETSHMDSHGEASLQSLMEWAARLENLAEADEPDQADYAQFHRGLDQLENTTEALIIDVELTLRRLRDRIRAS
jgi:hypothetical protein